MCCLPSSIVPSISWKPEERQQKLRYTVAAEKRKKKKTPSSSSKEQNPKKAYRCFACIFSHTFVIVFCFVLFNLCGEKSGVLYLYEKSMCRYYRYYCHCRTSPSKKNLSKQVCTATLSQISIIIMIMDRNCQGTVRFSSSFQCADIRSENVILSRTKTTY